MARLEGPESDDNGGFELWSDPSPSSRPCAFCRQEIGDAPSTSCRKCGTYYHPDCWDANDRKCAVYGCAPVSVAPPPPPPPPLPRERRASPWPMPTTVPARTSSSGWGRGWTIGLVIVVINVIRLIAGTSSKSSSHPPQIDYKSITERNRDFGNRDRSLTKMRLKLSEAQRKRGRFDEALKSADLAIEIDPNYAPAYHLRGDVRVDRGELEAAVSDYTRALELDHTDLRAIYDRGCALYDLGNWEECVKDFAQTYQNFPTLRAPSQLRFCLARSRLGQRKAAEKDLATVLADRENYLDPWTLQLLRFVAGLSDEETLFLEAASVPPEWRCQAYYFAGEVRLLNQDPEKAKVYFTRCLEIGSKAERECISAAAELRALEKK